MEQKNSLVMIKLFVIKSLANNNLIAENNKILSVFNNAGLCL